MTRAVERRSTCRFATVVALCLFGPAFLLLAIVPLLLLLTPVAWIGIPFIVPAMLSGTVRAREQDKLRTSWRATPLASSAVQRT